MRKKVVSYLKLRGFQRGVMGSSRNWLAVWAGINVASFLHRRLTRTPVKVERIVLKQGQAIEIRDTGTAWERVEAVKR